MKPLLFGGQVLDAMGPTADILTGATAERFKELLGDSKASPKDFQSILAPVNLVAILVASNKPPAEMPEVFRRAIIPLSDLIEREFPDVKKSNAFQQAVRASHELLNASEEPVEVNDVEMQPTTVSAVLNVPFLVGASENLNPISRILFRTNRPGAEFEFFANAEQLSAIASTLATYLAHMLEHRASLATKGIAKIAEPANVATTINNLERALKTIRQFAPAYGIVLDVPDAAEEPPALET